MNCLTCIRWARLRMKPRQVSRYGRCHAPQVQHPVWMDARYPDTAAADRPLQGAPLMPDVDGTGCLAFKLKGGRPPLNARRLR